MFYTKRLSEICEYRCLALTVDAFADICNIEQLSFCVRTVDKILHVKEDFLVDINWTIQTARP